jgi:hypothetical protein
MALRQIILPPMVGLIAAEPLPLAEKLQLAPMTLGNMRRNGVRQWVGSESV